MLNLDISQRCAVNANNRSSAVLCGQCHAAITPSSVPCKYAMQYRARPRPFNMVSFFKISQMF